MSRADTIALAGVALAALALLAAYLALPHDEQRTFFLVVAALLTIGSVALNLYAFYLNRAASQNYDNQQARIDNLAYECETQKASAARYLKALTASWYDLERSGTLKFLEDELNGLRLELSVALSDSNINTFISHPMSELIRDAAPGEPRDLTNLRIRLSSIQGRYRTIRTHSDEMGIKGPIVEHENLHDALDKQGIYGKALSERRIELRSPYVNALRDAGCL